MYTIYKQCTLQCIPIVQIHAYLRLDKCSLLVQVSAPLLPAEPLAPPLPAEPSALPLPAEPLAPPITAESSAPPLTAEPSAPPLTSEQASPSLRPVPGFSNRPVPGSPPQQDRLYQVHVKLVTGLLMTSIGGCFLPSTTPTHGRRLDVLITSEYFTHPQPRL